MNDSKIIKTIKFDPHKHPWPECVKPHGDFVPRNMSWGYIETGGQKIHVMAHDTIVFYEDGSIETISAWE